MTEAAEIIASTSDYYIRKAVLAERERCAKIAETTPIEYIYNFGPENRTVDNGTATKRAIAARIRSGE